MQLANKEVLERASSAFPNIQRRKEIVNEWVDGPLVKTILSCTLLNRTQTNYTNTLHSTRVKLFFS